MKLQDRKLAARPGAFSIGLYEMENYTDAVKEALSRVLITRCEFSYAARSFKYEGFSMDFEEVKDQFLPVYYVKMKNNAPKNAKPNVSPALLKVEFDGFSMAKG